MTMFFIPDVNIEPDADFFDDPHRLVLYSDVIVIATDDEWITTKDRHQPHGQIVEPPRRAELLSRYTTIIKPTNYEREDE